MVCRERPGKRAGSCSLSLESTTRTPSRALSRRRAAELGLSPQKGFFETHPGRNAMEKTEVSGKNSVMIDHESENSAASGRGDAYILLASRRPIVERNERPDPGRADLRNEANSSTASDIQKGTSVETPTGSPTVFLAYFGPRFTSIEADQECSRTPPRNRFTRRPARLSNRSTHSQYARRMENAGELGEMDAAHRKSDRSPARAPFIGPGRPSDRPFGRRGARRVRRVALSWPDSRMSLPCHDGRGRIGIQAPSRAFFPPAQPARSNLGLAARSCRVRRATSCRFATS
jgi:hypothetical protein